MGARIGGAFVDVDLASGAGESPRTDARVRIDAVDALGVVHARPDSAVVDVDLTILPGEPGHASALVPVGFVGATASVETRLGSALVQVGLAIDSGVTGIADAAIAIDLVQALGVVAARIRVTFVDIDLAILAGITGLAGAGVVPGLVGTGAAIEAGSGGAIIAIWASASETGIFVVRAIVFLILVPDTVGQFGFTAKTGEVGGVDVDGTSALTKKIDSSDLPSVVVASEGLFKRSVAKFLANDFSHDIVELIVANRSPGSFVVNLDSAFEGRFSSDQSNRHAGGGARETRSGIDDDWSSGGGNGCGGTSIGTSRNLFSGWVDCFDGGFAFLLSEDLGGGVGDVQSDDVDLGESWISRSALETATNDDFVFFLGIFADWMRDLDAG